VSTNGTTQSNLAHYIWVVGAQHAAPQLGGIDLLGDA
jgi:hypothetical protein